MEVVGLATTCHTTTITSLVALVPASPYMPYIGGINHTLTLSMAPDCSTWGEEVECKGTMADLLTLYSSHSGILFNFTLQEGANEVARSARPTLSRTPLRA